MNIKTIEWKAKAYNEVREKIALRFGSNVAEEIFSEFEMSEDERIRKELIKHLKEGVEGYMPAGGSEDYARWLAWLEKQVPIDVEKVLIGAGKDIALSIIDFLDRNTLEMDLSSMECADLESAVIDADWSKVYDYMKKKLEKQGGQKPADKVEPKFQNGQWIVWQNKCYKVNYNGCGYELIDQNGLSTSLEYGTVDTSARLYDVTEDTKDGDVLASKDGDDILIFRNFDTNTSFSSYYNIAGRGELGWSNKSFIPATKEQRDTLMKAMKEEGYEWSEETHELKKISQRMVSAEAKEALYDKPTDEEMKELLRTEYEKGRADAIAEMKSSWSEEDEVRLQACLDTLQAKSLFGVVDTVMTKWLKSLKDRVILQPETAWSIEDEKVIAIINNALTESNTPPDDYDNVYDWLESIKQRIEA